MADDADTWYEDLSGGQKRRTCVGVALVNDPDLLFLDEPTTGIDPAGRRDLWALLEGLAAGGTTVFLTSHSMDEVERISDRVGLLRDGRLVAVGTPEALVDEHGGPARLVVGTGDEAATDAGATAVRDAGFDVERGEGELVLEGVTPRELGRAVAALDEADVAFESLTWTEPNLEDVYLRLTGEEFEGAYTPGASVVDAADAADAADADDATDAGPTDAGADVGGAGEGRDVRPDTAADAGGDA
jgi:ABC-2 type transport system ATP-binding protein